MSLSRGHSFSDDELDALDVWDVSDYFENNKTPILEKTVKKKPAATLTVEEIENMQTQAYDEAFAQGKQEGYETGFLEGSKKGYDQGFEQGNSEGSKKGYEENLQLLQQKAAEFISLSESLYKPFEDLDVAVEKELVNLALGVANQLIRREIKIDPGQIVAVIREAVKALPLASQKLTLYMHPEDAELVRSSLALDAISPPWNIIEDPLITRGGCKVETETSVIDTTVENRLAAIVATVLGGEREEDEQQ